MIKQDQSLFSFTIAAPDGQRFAPAAFASLVDAELPLRFGFTVTNVRLVDVEVAEDGSLADLTFAGDCELGMPNAYFRGQLA
jgi:hypothetical protein